MPVIEINGKKIEAESGEMIIEVADQLGIQIPRFCYHKKLSIAANCRMCLVDVEKTPKPLPACATPVTEGMKVWTRSAKALQAQKSVMEFLLINHPLDCPICDQGGECELQDLSMGYGKDVSRFTEGKRVVQDNDIGPLISTDMTRCIQCTRCVRFGTEIAGMRELGATGRGEHTEIGTFIEKNVDSEVSGNIIDLCPVGALTSKPYRFTARGWELTQRPSIAPHDGVGSHLFIHIRRNQIMRVVPRENESINEVWLSDRDRFSYEALNSSDRLQQPKIKRSGRWYDVTWTEALEHTATSLLDLKNQLGGESIGTLVSPNATLEECYLLQKLMRSLGAYNIDHRLRQSDFRNQENMPLFPSLGVSIQALEEQQAVILVGSHIQKEQPILALKLRQMTLKGGKVFAVNPVDFSFNFDIAEKVIVPGGDLVLGLAGVAKAVLEKSNQEIPLGAKEWLADVKPSEADIEIANHLGENSLILLGALAISHPLFHQLVALANLITKITAAKIGLLSDGVNAAGAWLTGCVPHRLSGGREITESEGLHTTQMWEQNLKGYVLFNIEPDLDSLDGLKAVSALQKAKQVIAITPFVSKALLEYADVLLPMTPFTETSGTWVNMEGQWQSFQAVVPSLGESRPGWKICRVLGSLCHSSGFEFESSEEIKEAFKAELLETGNDKTLKDQLENWPWACPNHLELLKTQHLITRIAPVPLYASDGLVRRAKSLQQTKDAGSPIVYINKRLAGRFELTGNKVRVTQSGISLTLKFLIDDSLPDNSALIENSLPETVSLGGGYATLELEPIKEER